MRKSCKPTRKITIGNESWSERELAQLIRRRMITRGPDSKKIYKRKPKHNNGINPE